MEHAMKVTPAGETEVPQIAALWHAGWHEGHGDIVPDALLASRTLAEFTDRTRTHLDATRVARVGGVLAGFFMTQGDELYQFYVDAAFRGQGVAAALMQVAEATLPRGRVWLACTVGNDRAARFYEKCGWHRSATERYEVETAAGAQAVTVWRFVKVLAP